MATIKLFRSQGPWVAPRFVFPIKMGLTYACIVDSRFLAHTLAVAVEASSSRPAPSPRTDTNNGKGVKANPSCKRQRIFGAILVATSPLTLATALELRALNLFIGELKRRVTIGDATREHAPCFALVQVVMLPRDVVDFHVKDGVTACNLTIIQNVQPYSSILLLSFDEEKYANLPTKEDEEVANGGTEVARAEVEKDPTAEIEAPRPEGDWPNNLP
ncbi:hypothetical protein Acr_00g0032080 [Actinidia rufa]|uniref:Uncharacterized protein n=1 Tax=Actinidia rufa TaxID=165716 RepID=A0A7J0DFR6_9ERIC|nr:hypothetical protein Acr_00g0032080 [Actinidia rufa]